MNSEIVYPTLYQQPDLRLDNPEGAYRNYWICHFALLSLKQTLCRRPAVELLGILAGRQRGQTLSLRVQDIDFARSEITVRDGKGASDRVTMLPESLKRPLQRHLPRSR